MAAILIRPQCVNGIPINLSLALKRTFDFRIKGLTRFIFMMYYIPLDQILFLFVWSLFISNTIGLVGDAIFMRVIAVNTLRPRQNDHHFSDDIFKFIFLNENIWIWI